MTFNIIHSQRQEIYTVKTSSSAAS